MERIETDKVERDLIDTFIIGAGISGLLVAESLGKQSALSCRIVDKGRGPGGRMATRRMDQATFDHGTQFMTARSEAFTVLIQDWLNQGWIFPWFSDQHPRYAAYKGMNMLVKQIAQKHKVDNSMMVETVSPVKEGYMIKMRDLQMNTLGSCIARSVVMTCPIPQVLSILSSSGYNLEDQDLRLLEQVEYTKCLTILIQTKNDEGLLSGFLRNPVPGVISWIADNRQKGISQAGSLTIHLEPEWSMNHFSANDTQIWELLLPIFMELLGKEVLLNASYQIKRWRYAQALHVLEESFLDVGIVAPLVICGDAFAAMKEDDQSKVENAALSGMAAGQYVSHRMKSM